MRKQKNNNFMMRFSTVVVKKKGIIFVLFLAALVFSCFSRTWVTTDDQLTSYLSSDTETRQGLDIMDNEFVTFATAEIMVEHVTYEQALTLFERLESVDGVKSAEFDDSPEHYNAAAALFSITFEGEDEDEISVRTLETLKEMLSNYDTYVYSQIGNPTKKIISEEMLIVDGIALVVVAIVLLITSRTYAEVPVLLITFGAAALLNMGTNYLMGTISFVSDSIGIVLQLALSLDYGIILLHRYMEEHEQHEANEAAVLALSKAIPEIAASSLTTVGGMLALCFMEFRLGYDLGTVLIKAILLSLLSVFLLMPGLLVLFSGLIDRTHHRSFVPKIPFLGRFAYKTRYVVPPLFAVILVAVAFFANRVEYVYDGGSIDSIRHNATQIAKRQIRETFGDSNQMAIMVPSGDFDKEERLVGDLSELSHVARITAFANTEATDGYYITSRVTPRQFSEIAEIDVSTARLLFSGYAVKEENYGQILTNLDNYTVALIDIFTYVNEQRDNITITLPEKTEERLDELEDELEDGRRQLMSDRYSRIVLELDLPIEQKESFEYLEIIRGIIARYYDEYYVVGDTPSCNDLKADFVKDNILISVLTIAFVMLVLFFTFKSAGLPVLLILIIQGSIWCNFTIPELLGRNVYFLTYLIISAIQMGANIDYAIVISSRYMDLKEKLPLREAMIETLNLAFPTVITSGSSIVAAGAIILFVASNGTISAIGKFLFTGSLISVILVLFVLPQILLLGDILLKKTAVKFPELRTGEHKGTMRIDGRVRGQINGFIDAEIHGVLRGDLNAVISIGASVEELSEVKNSETTDKEEQL